MIKVSNLRLELGEEEASLKGKAAKKLRIPEGAIGEFRIIKKSLDARKKDDIHYIYSCALSCAGEARLLERTGGRDAAPYAPRRYEIPRLDSRERPVVIGFGPGGMFAALVLARAGLRPIVIERGQEVTKRRETVERFRAGGALDSESNVQFGEGGAGTFSDGKLNTGTHDFRMSWVLEQFYLHGAKESVLYEAKPHIGTDILIGVVQSIRREIISLGGELRFETRFERLLLEGGALCGIELSHAGKTESLCCRHAVLAIGHSARDTLEALHAQGIRMERKPFSMGVRIEHLQSDINHAQYGRAAERLPAADYALNVHLPDGTSAYTFCMCPGGQVFAAASEERGVVTNGMSYSARDGENANSALLVTLNTEDFPGEGVLAGMYWQRELERRAYEYTGSYCAPAQLVGDFLADRPSAGPGRVRPSYEPGVFWGDLRQVLPPRITEVMKNALPELGKKLSGFDAPDAVMTGPETRSSSPVRILRDAALNASVQGLYPCGEGAGYAGGITSAAVDGMRCAEAVITAILQATDKNLQ